MMSHDHHTSRLTRPFRPLRVSLASVALGAATVLAGPMTGGVPVGATVQAQELPAGVDPAAIEAALAAPISVAAGQTSTVSLPVAVEASYSGGGWEVSASGGAVTITAPAEGGQVSIPVTALGRSATITLVATAPEDAQIGGGGSAADPARSSAGDDADSGATDGTSPVGGATSATDPAEDGAAPAAGDGAGTGAASASAQQLPAVPGTPADGRKPAAAVDDSAAERIYLESDIVDNVITAKLGISEALNLYNRFGNIDENTVILRYVDGAGNIIEGVKRDIDAGARTLTLTYPEGQAPDNPFIMQLVKKDGSGVSVEAVLRDPDYASADDASPDEIEAEHDSAAESSSNSTGLLVAAAVGAAVLVVLFVALVVWSRRRRNK